MADERRRLIERYVDSVQKIYGSHLKKVILYGSCARGDDNPDSDVDLMILVDLSEEEAEAFWDSLSELGFEYNVQYDIWMMPVVKNIVHFKKWSAVYPFYYNFMSKEAVLQAYQAILPGVKNILECLIVFNAPFTLVKGLLCVAATTFIYKPLSPFLKGSVRNR